MMLYVGTGLLLFLWLLIFDNPTKKLDIQTKALVGIMCIIAGPLLMAVFLVVGFFKIIMILRGGKND